MTEGRKESITERPQKFLDRGWQRQALVHDLALNEKTQAQLARQYGISRAAVCEFNKRHQATILEVRADLDNEFAGLWISEKKRRVAELQGQADMLRELIEEERNRASQLGFTAEGDSIFSGPDLENIARLSRRLEATLRNAAEELGQLPSRVAMVLGDEKGSYTINGVDIAKMQ